MTANEPKDGAPAGAVTGSMGPDTYIRQLGLSFSTEGGVSTGRLPWAPALRSANGWIRLGALAVLADCISGYRAIRDFEGAWIGTSELAIHGPFGEALAGVVATADLLRRRRTGAVYEVRFHNADGGSPLAVATVTLGLLSRQGERKVPAAITGRSAVADAASALESLDDLLPVERPTDGHGSALSIADEVRNSWGVVSGGIISLLTEAEAERVAGLAVGGPCSLEALGMHFLAPGRVGPIVARAALLSDGHRAHGTAAHLRVRIHDAGADNRLIATASATAAPAGPLLR